MGLTPTLASGSLMRASDSLRESEILPLAVSLEKEDARSYEDP